VDTLKVQLVLVVLVDRDRGITRQPDELGIVGQAAPELFCEVGRRWPMVHKDPVGGGTAS
jgi:hypothetical protein